MKLASLFSVVFVLAMASAGIGAEPPAAAGPAASGPESDGVVVLDNNTLWRHFLVTRCAFVRGVDGKLEPWDLVPLGKGKTWLAVAPEPAASTAPSPLPPADWAGLAMDDSAWPRVRLPQPVETHPGRPQRREGGTASVLLRGRFEVKDPAQVKSCSLSLEYWGGVVVYVNGKEVARGHVPGHEPDLLALAEDYPVEVFITPDGKPLAADASDAEKNQDRLALRDRNLRDVAIPAALLCQGVNVLAIEVHTAPAYIKGRAISGLPLWPPIGLLSARLTVSPAGAAVANVARPGGIRVWNCAAYDTVTAFDYGDPWELLRPIVIRAARNSVFSGRLMVGSDTPIKGLKVTVSDLTQTGGGAKLPAAAVRVRYAAAATPDKCWVAPHRFDGLLDAIPVEMPVIHAPPLKEARLPKERFFGLPVDRAALVPRAVAPLWFTARVPKDAKPGVYEGKVSVEAEGLPSTSVPLRVSVCDWTMPDPMNFRVHNLAYHSGEAVAWHYEVPLWSDKHFELMGKSHALMAEAGSRQVYANLCVDSLGGGSNPESLIRWIKQPDGSYKHDFTIFDKFLDMVAKSVGKPLPLRLNCWPSLKGTPNVMWVSLLDPATGTIESLKQPDPGTEEALAFWRPVFDEVLKKLQARGWLDVTALGWVAGHGGPKDDVAKLAQKLWPDGVWAIVTHEITRGWRSPYNPWVTARYANTCYYYGVPSVRGYRELLKPQPGFFCNTYRWCWREFSPLTDQRRVGEDIIMSGRDGISDFGPDLFPIKNPKGLYYCVPNVNYPSGPAFTQKALLYPGPDGPVATERFEMFREGVELAEALLFIERAIQEKRLSAALQQRAERGLEARSQAFIMNWFGLRDMPAAEEDAKLLDLAGEVAREIQKSAK